MSDDKGFHVPPALRDIALQVAEGSLPASGGYVRVPTRFFVTKIDVGSGQKAEELPSVDFFAGEPLQLLRAAGQPYSPLALSVHEFVWIREQDLPLLKRFGEWVAMSISPEEARAERLVNLKRASISVMQDLFENPDASNISRSTQVVSSFVYTLMRDPEAYTFLTQLSEHDPYTLQHSVGTSVNAVILGRKLGISSEKELCELGQGGLLHDIGKVKVKKEIINKNGPLDEIEWEEMRAHALAGYEIVQAHPDLSERTKRSILEHHEDKNGTGYPKGLKGDQIEIFAKIVGICDIFNALTTDRSYSKARTPFEAFQFMRDKLKHKVDEDIFAELVRVYGGDLG